MTTELLTAREAAARLKVSRTFLSKARGDGTGPAFVKLGSRNVRYRPEALYAWLESATRQRTGASEAEAVQ